MSPTWSQETDVVPFISGGPAAIAGARHRAPGQNPFPSPEKELYLHNWVPFSFCVLEWAWRQ